MDLIYLIDIVLLKFSISSCVNFGRLCLSRHWSIDAHVTSSDIPSFIYDPVIWIFSFFFS
jgi:hypothetical protein